MKWVTRADCHVDRTACAWLIRRYIDRDAAFEFVTDPVEVAADATPFDIAGYRYSHHDGDCTFEVMVRAFKLDNPGLNELGRIVHEADVEDERYDAPESVGLDAIIRGLGAQLDDHRLIDVSAAIYDGLLAYLAGRGADGQPSHTRLRSDDGP